MTAVDERNLTFQPIFGILPNVQPYVSCKSKRVCDHNALLMHKCQLDFISVPCALQAKIERISSYKS
jgi:hypothetical protein